MKTDTNCLSSLLRGEIAATETYEQAIAKVGNQAGAEELRRIHQEHCDAVNTLESEARRCGCNVERSSGAWGTFAQAVEGTAKIFGNTAALKALKEGEEQGVSDYEKAVQSDELPADCKSAIVTRLLPQTRGHIATLDRLMSLQA